MAETGLGKQTVLIIEGEAAQRHLLKSHLESLEFTVLSAEDGKSGLVLWEQNRSVRVVITDLGMPEVDGFDVIKTICREDSRDTYVMVLTMHDKKDVLVRALSLGANDFISKPIEKQELSLRMAAAKHLLRLKDQNKLVSKIAELAAARTGEIDFHLKRTKAYCRLIAEDLHHNCPSLGITKEAVEDISEISVLHDIGKIFIPDNLLNKRGRYTPKEYDIIKEHTTLGAAVLKKLYDESGSPFLLLGYEMALGHHERWDGDGYPRGLKKEATPLEARIMAFADAYDAILSRRPYKDALPPAHADAMIVAQKGKQFDPNIVESYERNKEMFVEIHEKYPESNSNNPFWK